MSRSPGSASRNVRTGPRALIRVVTAALSVTASVGAEPTTDALSAQQSSDSAKALFSKGLELGNLGRLRESIQAYEEAYGIQPHAAVLYNIGLTYHKMMRPRKALEYFGRYLDYDDDQVTAAEREEVLKIASQILTELLHRSESPPQPSSVDVAPSPPTHQLELTGVPQNAEVTLDGRPWSGKGEVQSGPHAVSVVAPGFDGWHRNVRLTQGKSSRIHVQLRALPAPTVHAPARSALEAARRETLAYTLGATGLAIGGVAVTTFVWNQGRFEDWKSEHEKLQPFSGKRGLSEEIIVRQANNSALSDQIKTVRGAWIVSGAASIGLLGSAAYLLLTGESPGASEGLDVGRNGVHWRSTW